MQLQNARSRRQIGETQDSANDTREQDQSSQSRGNSPNRASRPILQKERVEQNNARMASSGDGEKQYTIVPRPRTIKSVRAEHARIEKEERDQERERRRLARARTTATAQAVPGTQVAPPTPNGARPPPATPAAPKKPTVSAAQPTSANRALRNEFAQFAQEIMELVNEPLTKLEKNQPAWGAYFRELFGGMAGRAIAGLPPPSPGAPPAPPEPLAPPAPPASSAPPAIPTTLGPQQQTSRANVARAVSGPNSYAGRAGAAADLPEPPRTSPAPSQSQPQGQTKVMIRFPPDHPARKTDPYIVKQKVAQIMGNDKTVRDAWTTQSGFAILARDSAQADAITAKAKEIETVFGATSVARHEKWAIFVVGPISKRIQTLDGLEDPVTKGHLQNELEEGNEAPIRRVAWTLKSKDPTQPDGYVSVSVPESWAARFRVPHRLLTRSVTSHRVNPNAPVVQCGRCYGFHPERLCVRDPRCHQCGGPDDHQLVPCTKAARCMNCCGPHGALDRNCPARPKRKDGLYVRPSKRELRSIRWAGGRASHELAKSNDNSPPIPTATTNTTATNTTATTTTTATTNTTTNPSGATSQGPASTNLTPGSQ